MTHPAIAAVTARIVERSAEKVGLCTEIMAESRRNPDLARLHTELELDIKTRLVAMLRDVL